MSIASSLPTIVAVTPLVYVVVPYLFKILPQKPQFLLKCIWVLLSTLAMSVAGIVVSIVCALLNKRYLINYIVSRMFSTMAAWPCGVSYRIVGEEHLDSHPAIVVCNHQSSMDMMVLGRVFPKHCVVMAKKELLYFPLLGMFMKLSNAIFIDRKNHKKAIESTNQAVADMKKHNSGIWIFPEGTRSRLDSANLLPFKKGAFHLAIQAQFPILPIVAAGYSHIYDSSKQSFPGGDLEIRVLEPIPTTGMTADNVNELMEKTRNLMLKHLKEMGQINSDDKTDSDTPTTLSTRSSNESTSSSTTAATAVTTALPVDEKVVDAAAEDAGIKQRRTTKD